MIIGGRSLCYGLDCAECASGSGGARRPRTVSPQRSMIMQYRQDWTKRIGLALVVAATGSLAADTAEAAGHKGRSGHGPIFKTLDALAGGIEAVLERTVL